MIQVFKPSINVLIAVLLASCHRDRPGQAPVRSTQSTSALKQDIGEIKERFVIVGDSGHPGIGQRRVSQAIRLACQARGGCQYGILNGDNIYPAGVLSTSDPQWFTHFEEAFATLGFPFYAALGNHDYGGITETSELACSKGTFTIDCLTSFGSAIGQATGGVGLDPARAQHQIDYATSQPAFIMDHHHYTFSTHLIDFAILDTTPIYWDDANTTDSFRLSTLRTLLDSKMFEFAQSQTATQAKVMNQWRAQSSKRWRFAIGHHPYLSNGSHGNAGNYDGTGGLEGSGLPSGTTLKRFIDKYVIQAGTHVYAYGHDHNLMDLGEHVPPDRLRGTQMILSGSGSKIKERRERDEAENRSLYEVTCYGFVMVEASYHALRFLYIVAPSGKDSECATQQSAWQITHVRVVDYYEPR